MAVPWILMASYLYYHRDETLIPDTLYDAFTTTVRSSWDSITHPHRDLLTPIREHHMSSLFDVRLEDYPTICRSAACRLACIPFQ